jgi:hypothetical protein
VIKTLSTSGHRESAVLSYAAESPAGASTALGLGDPVTDWLLLEDAEAVGRIRRARHVSLISGHHGFP